MLLCYQNLSLSSLLSCSYKNLKVQNYRKGPDNFDDWCKRHKLPPEAVELLKGMLALDPKKRISATDAVLVSVARA
jgi:hypothetical protein